MSLNFLQHCYKVIVVNAKNWWVQTVKLKTKISMKTNNFKIGIDHKGCPRTRLGTHKKVDSEGMEWDHKSLEHNVL